MCESLDPFPRAHHGITTTRALLAAGYSSSTLTRLVQRGLLQRMYRGVYHVGLNPSWSSAVMAAVVAAGPGSVLSHSSAAMAWGILPRRRQRRIHVTVAGSRSVRQPGIRCHSSRLEPVDRTRWERVPITTPARTLVDLSASLPTLNLEQAVSRAVRMGMATRRSVREAAARRANRKGRARLRQVLQEEGGPALTRSRAESLFLQRLRESDLPVPHTNARIEHWEVDFLWRDARLVVEVDGFAYHSSREAFEQDRRKDQWLAARGFRVLRFTWRQIRHHPLLTVATIARILPEEG